MKKYILSENTTLVCGIPLHRIIALVDIPAAGVRKGDIGGWIYSEECLSQEGDCWICRDAAALGEYVRVDGNAIVGNPAFEGESTEPITILDDFANVLNNARVSGKVVIRDYGTVCQNATVTGDGVEIYDFSTVSGNAIVSDKARIGGYVTVTGEAKVTRNALINFEEYICDGEISATSQTRCSTFWGMMKADEHGEYIIFKNAIDNLTEAYKDYVDLNEIEWVLPDNTQEEFERKNDYRNYCHAIVTYNETSGRLSFSVRSPMYWLSKREIQIPFHEITEEVLPCQIREIDDIPHAICRIAPTIFDDILDKYFSYIHTMWDFDRNVYDEILTPRKYILTKPQEKTVLNPATGFEEKYFVYKVRYLHDIFTLENIFGDTGGFVESERNLSHTGKCRVERNAMCVGKACLYDDSVITDEAIMLDESYAAGNALIGGKARVEGHSEILNNARVGGNAVITSAVVRDRARVHGSAVVNTRATITDEAVVFGTAFINSHAIICDKVQINGGSIAKYERLFGNTTIVNGENVTEKNLFTIGRIDSNEKSHDSSFLVPRSHGNNVSSISCPLYLTFNFTEVSFKEDKTEKVLHGYTVANHYSGYFYFIPNEDDTTTVYNSNGVKLADSDPFIEACWKIRLVTNPRKTQTEND